MANVDTNKVIMLTAAAVTGSAVAFQSCGERTPQFGYAPTFQTIVAYGGDFDGATVTIQASPDSGATWIDTAVSFTDDGMANLTARTGLQYRAAVGSADSSTSITVVAYQ